MKKIGIAGIMDKSTRSDCKIELELGSSGGIVIYLKSKVEKLFGEDIRNQLKEGLAFFGIEHATINMEDKGALPFAIMARLEAAIRQVKNIDETWLPTMLSQNKYSTKKDKFRRSRLFVPGNSPKLMLNVGLHHPDAIILDLEDAVAPAKKDEARLMVRNALRAVDFYGAERMVRINQGERGMDDLECVIPHNPNIILIPKVETPADVLAVETKINAIKEAHNIDLPIWIMPSIESAKGILNAAAIAACSNNVVAITMGLEDFTADLGVQRTTIGSESHVANSLLILACKAASVQPIASVFSDVADMQALAVAVQAAKAMGFEGMGCIHPRQVAVVHDNFAPTCPEITKAKHICLAFEEATKKGLGVISIGTKMIDPPVVKRAIQSIELAVSCGKLNKDWRDTDAN